jgi:RNA polymerase sigma factor (sigma-70 family)
VPTRTRFRRAEPYGPEDEPDLLAQYLSQIGKTPLLTAEEEVELARRIAAGVQARRDLDAASAEDRDVPADRRAGLPAAVEDGQAAKDHMIRANLRLVVSVAKRYFRRGLPLLDIIQEGNLGLIRAVEKFDHTKGFKFSTYAVWWIRQSIERGLANKARTVRLPVEVVEDLSRYARIEQRLLPRLGREPTVEEIAAEAGQPAERVVELRRQARDTLSLDTPVGDGETLLGDLIADTHVAEATDPVEFKELAEQIRGLVDTLPPREAMIITLRYGLNNGQTCTLQQIAGRLGLTRERVRQLEKNAFAQLRDPERRQPLLAWAG